MTEDIDLDELDVGSDDEDTPPRGAWFWDGEGDPEDEPGAEPDESLSAVTPDPGGNGEAAAEETSHSGGTVDMPSPTTPETDSSEGADRTGSPVPHVPRENKNKPVGIPKDSGGAGADSAAEYTDAEKVAEHPDSGNVAEASGPHGGGVDDMAMVLTYQAVKRLEDPQLVIQAAKAWADWVGIVGDVESYVINKFQRDHGVDVDFFSGSGQSPAERLADIDEHSMFYSERMVVVGLPEDEAIAERADWEFVPLTDAAEKADWELTTESE